MVKLQPYNQGEYICDAYVIIDEKKTQPHTSATSITESISTLKT